MPVIGWHTLESYLEAKERVIRAAEDVVDRWSGLGGSDETDLMVGLRLADAVLALRSFYAHRGLRDPSTPGQQEPDAEQAHGETVH
jgi:hypothetical protein